MKKYILVTIKDGELIEFGDEFNTKEEAWDSLSKKVKNKVITGEDLHKLEVSYIYDYKTGKWVRIKKKNKK